MRRLITLALLGSLIAGAWAGPAQAITFGQPDGTRHPAVGALVIETAPGVKDWICTGTLIAPTVFLTAAHCLAGFGIAPHDVWVTFDPVFDPSGTFYRGTYHVNPAYATPPRSDAHDLAVVVLDEALAGIAPAQLPPAGYLDRRGVRALVFTAVGYGGVRDTKTGGPKTITYDGVRRFVSQTYQSRTDAWLTLSMNPATGNGGTCYGDSGGPHFVAGTSLEVSLTVTGDAGCRSTDKTYRLDTKESLDFVGAWLR